MSIGKKIVELRKKYNFTQEQLAQKVGDSRQTLANWEGDVTSPDLNQAGKLARILKVSLDEIADNDLEIICDDKRDIVYNNLVGKTCQIEIEDDFFDMYLTPDTPVKILDINSDFIKIEYEKKKEKCIKLIDVDLIMAIKVLLEA